ncbi:alpha/beta fold hydrolase [Microbacterium resistens]|uniref:alpha/beta fold hydrolase n=1 Tax=Microbacterium resistens TaxID=156977 RepID=UPI0008315B9D|nr:alpha/beta hydrolase [Microbacterium resistens]
MVTLDRVLQRPTARIAYRDSGRGSPTVVFLHGAGLDHVMFDDQADALVAAGARIVQWDLRAHGQSTLAPGTRFTAEDALDDLAALLDETQVSDPVLVGHSLGGNIAQASARMHSSRASGVVIVDSAWNAGPLSATSRFLLGLAAPSLALIPARNLPGLMAKASAVTPAAIERATETFGRMPKKTFLDVWRATSSFIAPDPAYRSPVPIGLMRGSDDQTGNISQAMGTWAAAEGVAEHVVANAGHIVTWDAPAQSTVTLFEILGQWHPQLVSGEG